MEEGAVVEEHTAKEATGGKERVAVTGGIQLWLHAPPCAMPAIVAGRVSEGGG
jgi:hypothetical protein